MRASISVHQHELLLVAVLVSGQPDRWLRAPMNQPGLDDPTLDEPNRRL
jgi:hypothetical protein